MVSKCFAKRAVLKKGGQRAFSEGKKEGILGRPVKKAREGTKRAKPETVIYPISPPHAHHQLLPYSR